MLCFLGHSHDNNCIAIAMLQRAIKQVGLRVITHPYISTGQPEFHLKSFDQTTPSSVLKFFHVYTHGTQYSTSYCLNWCIYINSTKWYIHTQKQDISWILLTQKHSSMNSNIYKYLQVGFQKRNKKLIDTHMLFIFKPYCCCYLESYYCYCLLFAAGMITLRTVVCWLPNSHYSIRLSLHLNHFLIRIPWTDLFFSFFTSSR